MPRSAPHSSAGNASGRDDQHEAVAAYARQAKDTELVQYATEIKVRAERRCGELLEKAPKNVGGRPSENQSHDATTLAPTLTDLGITKDESSRYQKLAAMPEEFFETAVATAKDTAGQVTSAFLLREAKKLTHEQIAPTKSKAKPQKGRKAAALRCRLWMIPRWLLAVPLGWRTVKAVMVRVPGGAQRLMQIQAVTPPRAAARKGVARDAASPGPRPPGAARCPP